jgi:protein involved in polysaccharide export with SLBB domain
VILRSLLLVFMVQVVLFAQFMPQGLVGGSALSPEYKILADQYLKAQQGAVEVNPSAKRIEEEGAVSDVITQPVKPLSSIEAAYADIETDHDVMIFDSKPELVVSDSVALQDSNKALRQVGYDMFQHQATVFYSNTVPPSGYVLTVGDTLTVFIYGKKEQVIELTLDVSGDVFLPSVGLIKISGLTIGEASEKVKQKMATHYVNFEFKMTLNSVQKINVSIVGDVNKPGIFSVNKFDSVLVLLSEAEGVKHTGSLRTIKVVRRGKVVRVVDLYDFLFKDKGVVPLDLKSNDTIVVSKIGDTVGVQGAVKSPGIYEVKRGESLQQIINYASGFTVGAYKNAIYINRLDDHFRRKVDVVYSNSKKELRRRLVKTVIKDGDLVMVKSRLNQQYGYINVRGHVHVPGKYAYRKGLTLGDLLDQAQGVQLNVYDTVQVYRYLNEDERTLISVSTKQREFKLADRDIVRVFNQRDTAEVMDVQVSGEVVHAGAYQYLVDMTLSHILLLAKPKVFSSLGNVELTRVSDNDSIVYYLDVVSDADFKLHAGDKLVVKLDNLRDQTVSIELKGEVKFPGKYRVKKGTRLDVVIARAGGFMEAAFLDGAVFTRENVKEYDELGQKKVIDDEKKRFIYDQSHLGNLAMDSKDSMALMMAARQEALKYLQNKTKANSGRVVVDLGNPRFIDSKDNFKIQDGDSLFIPTVPESVHLIGGVQQGISIAYNKSYGFKDYVNNVGGFTKYADAGNVYVFKASGRVFKNANNLDPGDIIYVPEKVNISFNWLQFLTNITSIISNAVTSIALVKSLQ